MDAQTFFNTFQPSAQSASDKTGVPALLILAQAALESGWGVHAPGNNFFGIKANKSWNGAKQLLTTHEYFSTNTGHVFPEIVSIVPKNGKYYYTVKDYFRAYDNAEQSFEDWANFLHQNSRYANVLTAPDTVSAAKALQLAGYSTSPTYADSLIVTAHHLSPSAIDPVTFAESLARVSLQTAKATVGVAASVAASPVGLVALSLAGIASIVYFLGSRGHSIGG